MSARSRPSSRVSRLCLAAAALAIATLAASARSGGCPLVRVDSSRLPDEVCEDAGTSNDVRFFNAFAWQSFLAVTWPAGAARGEPDEWLPVGTTDRPLVFETYKASWEVFAERDTPDQPGPPPGWDVRPATGPCGPTASHPDDLVISSYGELEDLAQAGEGLMEPPIATQNGEYVRYTTHFNSTLFNAIRDNRLYLAANLGKITLPEGSMAVKAAWMIVNAKTPRPERYYRRWAQVRRYDGRSCERKEVALIGLHVVKKTRLRPQFIWSTFEHRDNVPPGRGEPYALHDGDESHPTPDVNPFALSKLSADPPPFNIIRKVPMHPSTVALNAEYDKALEGRHAVWANYQLVMTQWPRDNGQPQEDGTPPNTIPGTLMTQATSYSNPAIETFFQQPITNGCMSCHNLPRERADFVWSLALHAWSKPHGDKSTKARDKLLRRLNDLVRKDK